MTEPKLVIKKKRGRRTWKVYDGVVKVGFPKGSQQDVINKAFWNEFGTPTIPSRPFMRQAFQRNIKKYQHFIRKQVKMNASMTERQLLTRLGLRASKDIKMRILKLRTPPNAPSTIRAKGSSNPLIDTAEMRQAVTYQVVTTGHDSLVRGRLFVMGSEVARI